MNNDVLEGLVGHMVEVRSQADKADFRDDGTLRFYDARWIVLEKTGGELLYFPIANVRLLKVLR